jgi:hypothetical protein
LHFVEDAPPYHQDTQISHIVEKVAFSIALEGLVIEEGNFDGIIVSKSQLPLAILSTSPVECDGAGGLVDRG